MAKQYYLGKDNEQFGPFQKNELLLNGMTGETLVWTEGMADWLPAKEVPELAKLLGRTVELKPEFDDFGNFDVLSRFAPEPPAPASHSPRSRAANAFQPTPSSFLGWNIAVTVVSVLLCCFGIPSFITGIIGIVKSAKVNKLMREGDREGAEVYSLKAKTMFFASLGLWVISLVILIVFSIIPADKLPGGDTTPKVKTEQSASSSSADIISDDAPDTAAEEDETSEEE